MAKTTTATGEGFLLAALTQRGALIPLLTRPSLTFAYRIALLTPRSTPSDSKRNAGAPHGAKHAPDRPTPTPTAVSASHGTGPHIFPPPSVHEAQARSSWQSNIPFAPPFIPQPAPTNGAASQPPPFGVPLQAMGNGFPQMGPIPPQTGAVPPDLNAHFANLYSQMQYINQMNMTFPPGPNGVPFPYPYPTYAMMPPQMASYFSSMQGASHTNDSAPAPASPPPPVPDQPPSPRELSPLSQNLGPSLFRRSAASVTETSETRPAPFATGGPARYRRSTSKAREVRHARKRGASPTNSRPTSPASLGRLEDHLPPWKRRSLGSSIAGPSSLAAELPFARPSSSLQKEKAERWSSPASSVGPSFGQSNTTRRAVFEKTPGVQLKIFVQFDGFKERKPIVAAIKVSRLCSLL